jgi:hypothetical protein
MFYINLNHDNPNTLFISTTSWADYVEPIISKERLLLVIWNDENIMAYFGNEIRKIFKENGLIESYFYDELEDNSEFVPSTIQILDIIRDSRIDKDSSYGMAVIEMKKQKIIACSDNASVLFYDNIDIDLDEKVKIRKFYKRFFEDSKAVHGKAEGLTIEDIAKKHKVSIEEIEKQLNKGISVEKEHTNDMLIAQKIAMDHLFEYPNYYDELEKMEKNFNK